ncbi:MAG: 4-hydroxy-3-methylbut-2-enyl diphosphate reductase [Chloroflexota bacterium]
MEIRKAAEMGFCYGVKRAIDILNKAVHQYGPLESLGPVVHNRQVGERLASEGIAVVESLGDLRGKVVAITTHGVAPEVISQMNSRGLQIVDTTCPFVLQAQRAAKALAEAGFSVIVFGDASHPEVRGVLGWAKGRGVAAIDCTELASVMPFRRVGVLSQTTQSPADFASFVKRFIDLTLADASELRIVNTICDATSKRQVAALKLSQEVELMLVIGGRSSANTRHLAEICRNAGVETHHIEISAELDLSWFAKRSRIGVTAGASTPDEAIDEVIRDLRRFSAGSGAVLS